jgi:peptidoglycan hydrolase-like protein with peptidoglycan-binding domain
VPGSEDQLVTTSRAIRVVKRFGGVVPRWTAGALIVGALAGWSLHTLLAPPPNVLANRDYTLVTAQQGTVGQMLHLNTSAQWRASSAVANRATGTVTELMFHSGSAAKPGDALYAVDERPVVVAQGTVPAFRDLAPGVRGKDVVQLRVMLKSLGYPTSTTGSLFDSGLSHAVRAWQRHLGLSPDGIVRVGDVIFVSKLPARLALHDLKVGTLVSGGESAVQLLPTLPAFTIKVPDGQAKLITPGMDVQISSGGANWHATITSITANNDSGDFTARLGGVDGKPICTTDCAKIPLGNPSLLPSEIIVVPEVTGVTVPAAALVTTADGRVGVRSPSGAFLPVTVVVSASGMAVVTGLQPGDQVRTPAVPSAENGQ